MKRPFRSAHARIWTVLAFLLPVLFFAALIAKQTVPADQPAVRLASPAAE